MKVQASPACLYTSLNKRQKFSPVVYKQMPYCWSSFILIFLLQIIQMVAGLYKPSCAAIDMKQGLQLSAINNFSYLCGGGGFSWVSLALAACSSLLWDSWRCLLSRWVYMKGCCCPRADLVPILTGLPGQGLSWKQGRCWGRRAGTHGCGTKAWCWAWVLLLLSALLHLKCGKLKIC